MDVLRAVRTLLSPVTATAQLYQRPAIGLDPSVIIEISVRLQAAAMDPLRWADAIETLRAAFGAKYASATTTTAHAPVALLRETHVGRSPTIQQSALRSALRDHDPRWQWTMHNFGRASASNLDIGVEQMRNSQAYKRQLHEQDIEYSLMLSELVDNRMIVALSLDRGHKQPPFGPCDVASLQALRPLLVKALETQLRLTHCERRQAELSAALGRLPVGIVLIDANKTVQFASQAAAQLLAKGDGLGLRQGRLRADHFAQERALQDSIGQAVRPKPDSGGHEDETLTVKRSSGRRDYELLVAPLETPSTEGSADSAAAFILIRDPETTPPLSWKLVQRLHSVSPAEAKLCVALAEGRALKAYAAQSDISVETARSQLKAAMSKTQTHRQAELIRLLLTGPAAYALLEP